MSRGCVIIGSQGSWVPFLVQPPSDLAWFKGSVPCPIPALQAKSLHWHGNFQLCSLGLLQRCLTDACCLLSPPNLWLCPPGVTAMHWAPPTASATYEQGSASASLASPGSVVTDVRPTTSDLALKAANVSEIPCKWSQFTDSVLRSNIPCKHNCKRVWSKLFSSYPHLSREGKKKKSEVGYNAMG